MILKKEFGDEVYSELYKVEDASSAIVEELFGYQLYAATFAELRSAALTPSRSAHLIRAIARSYDR